MEQGVLLRGLLYAVALLAGVLVFSKVRSLRTRQVFLLIVSYALYLTWGTWFLLVLLTSTAMNFLVGSWLRRRPSAFVVWAGLAFNLLLLVVFKYLPRVAVSVPVASLQKFSHLVLPLGISFWTFQAMSYLLDLYSGDDLDPSFVEFALYMAFFPIVISGPICRMPDMLPQFRSKASLSGSDLGRGICRIATGLLMMQIAQLLGKGIISQQGIDAGFDQMRSWSGPDVWCLALGYGLQIFFDFAGYSHIAIGAARMLGFTVPENFARPFASTTPSMFWTRWHMSLCFWIRDYVFLPLALLHRGTWWRKLCLLVAMVLFGVWHKATILFVLFGCYHGVLLILHRQVQQAEERFSWKPAARAWTGLSWLVTVVAINLGWLFFRANSLSQAGEMFSALLSPSSYVRPVLSPSLYGLVMSLALAYVLVLFSIDALDRYSERLAGGEPAASSAVIALLVRERWVWIVPIWATASLLVAMLMPGQGHGANVFMYRFY